ncbi:hypothetical protein CANARDRAFT_6157 [[Candida] arabinofermentans NRRL YB-2248]|uniref:DNA-binding protein RAP1 n=1 Tax=[Candida] arabinofermentans NRRL YB-2248 TaxID=983967 RepID=A0A1E4T4C1_9ASCO|nr:hypothetical protein CANARDRAFT_6157 [[Candida] arabinofermentans NRRL YB-2248]
MDETAADQSIFTEITEGAAELIPENPKVDTNASEVAVYEDGLKDLFTDLNSKPMKFHLCLPVPEHILEYITKGGGEVVNEYNGPDIILIADPRGNFRTVYEHLKIVSYLFVEDSYKKGTLMRLVDYTVHDPNARSALRYFTPEEDAYLFEEIRKRPWFGYKGHQIYREIAQLDFFVARHRTAASLRERIRTLKYDIKYVYLESSNSRTLQKDSQGRLIRDYDLRRKANGFTAVEDFLLCKDIYLNLNPIADEHGFESMNFTTGFFDLYHDAYPQHTAESWRQRYKNFLSVFGIANYLKYYIVEYRAHRAPFPANLANKEWMQARKHQKRTGEGPLLYFPHVPTDNDLLKAEYLESIPVPEPRPKNDRILATTASMFLEPKPMLTQEQNIAAAAQRQQAVREADDHDDQLHPAKRSKITPQDASNSNLTIDPQIGELHYNETPAFVDDVTSSFLELTFSRSRVNYGPPMDLQAIASYKEQFDKMLYTILDPSTAMSPKNLSKELANLGIQEYYSVFLMLRCNSKKSLVLECIKNYIATDGAEYLARRPGIFSNKAVEWLRTRDPSLLQILKEYHGEAEVEQQLKSVTKTNSNEWKNAK